MSGAAATVMLPTPRGPVLFAQVDIALPVGVTLAVRGLTTLCRIATHRGRRSNKSNARRSYGAIGGRQGRRNTRNLYPRSPSAPRYNFKRHFGLEFNNYLRSALTLRGASSLPVSSGNEPRVTTRLPLKPSMSAIEGGRRTRSSSVLNQVDVDPVSRPIRTASNRSRCWGLRIG